MNDFKTNQIEIPKAGRLAKRARLRANRGMLLIVSLGFALLTIDPAAAVWLNQYLRLNQHLQLEQPNTELRPYSVDPADYSHIDYAEVAQATEAMSPLQGKIAIIGLDLKFVPSNSRFSIPSRNEHAGPTEVLAAAICTMLDGRSKRLTLMWIIITCILLFSVAASVSVVSFRLPIAMTVCIAIFATYFVGAVAFYRYGWLTGFAVTRKRPG